MFLTIFFFVKMICLNMPDLSLKFVELVFQKETLYILYWSSKMEYLEACQEKKNHKFEAM